MQEIIGIIGTACLAWLLAKGAEPVTYLKYKLDLSEDNMGKHVWLDWVIKLIHCSMCLGFWFGLFFYMDVKIAAFVSVLGWVLDIYSTNNNRI